MKQGVDFEGNRCIRQERGLQGDCKVHKSSGNKKIACDPNGKDDSICVKLFFLPIFPFSSHTINLQAEQAQILGLELHQQSAHYKLGAAGSI